MRALWLIALVLAAKGAFAYTICGFPGPSVVGFDDFIGTIARGDVAYIGEIHTDAQVHAAQLDTLRGLAALGRPLVLAMEMFQIPYQQYLDAYIRGELSEEGLFRETEYATRWGYDPGLYSPILRLAKEQHIPLRAIGVPTELIEQVRQKGATNTQSPYLPSPLLLPSRPYLVRLEAAYEDHPRLGSLSRFLEVQLVWDNGMAFALQNALLANPGALVMVMIGAGHVQGGLGVPELVEEMAPGVLQSVVVPVLMCSELELGEDFGIVIEQGGVE